MSLAQGGTAACSWVLGTKPSGSVKTLHGWLAGRLSCSAETHSHCPVIPKTEQPEQGGDSVKPERNVLCCRLRCRARARAQGWGLGPEAGPTREGLLLAREGNTTGCGVEHLQTEVTRADESPDLCLASSVASESGNREGGGRGQNCSLLAASRLLVTPLGFCYSSVGGSAGAERVRALGQ